MGYIKRVIKLVWVSDYVCLRMVPPQDDSATGNLVSYSSLVYLFGGEKSFTDATNTTAWPLLTLSADHWFRPKLCCVAPLSKLRKHYAKLGVPSLSYDLIITLRS